MAVKKRKASKPKPKPKPNPKTVGAPAPQPGAAPAPATSAVVDQARDQEGAQEGAQEYYDSIGSAAAALNIAVPALRRAKRQGAPGFKGSRVYPALLLPWLQAREKNAPIIGDDKTALECAILRRKLEDMEFESQKQRGLYNLKSDEDAWKRATAEKIKAILRTKLKNELPPKLEGLKAAEISAKMDPLIAEIVELFR